MSESIATAPKYSLGHAQEEILRLQKQNEFLEVFTRRCFQDAGIKAGMKVLDVGSGAGDVALLLAEMVGPEGQVVGIEINPQVLETARQRAQAAGYTNITFRAGDAQEIELDNDFDAVAGRLILFHLKQPATVLRKLIGHLQAGGLVVFQDYNIASATSYPVGPTLRQALYWIQEAFIRAGADPHVGLKLAEIFREAGLPQPKLRCEASIGAGLDWDGYDQVTGVIRSLLPLIVKTGMATAEEVGIDTLTDRLREEVAGRGGIGRGPDIISAWTRKA